MALLVLIVLISVYLLIAVLVFVYILLFVFLGVFKIFISILAIDWGLNTGSNFDD